MLAAALASRCIRLVRGFLLARLLAPEVFGAYALIGALVGPLGSAANLGLAPLVARERDVDPRLLATAEWISRVGSTTIFAALAIAVAAWTEVTSRRFLLGPGLAVGAATALYLLPQVNVGLLQYSRRFSKIALMELLFDLVWACVAILLAFNTRTVWALAGAELAAQLSRVTYARLVAPSRVKAQRHAGHTGRILKFSSVSTAGTVVWTAAFAAPTWILQRRFPDGAIGQFSVAYTYSQIAAAMLGGIVSRLSLPAIAGAPERERVGVAWDYANAVTLVLAPVTGLLSCAGGAALLVLIGAKWQLASTLFAVLVWGMAARVVFPFLGLAQVGGRPGLEVAFGVLALGLFAGADAIDGWRTIERAAFTVAGTDLVVFSATAVVARWLWGAADQPWKLSGLAWATAVLATVVATRIPRTDLIDGAMRALVFILIYGVSSAAIPSLRRRYAAELLRFGRFIAVRFGRA